MSLAEHHIPSRVRPRPDRLLTRLWRARRRAAEQDGWALIIAVALTGAMLALGLATFAFVDEQQRQSGLQRQKDAAFNLAEAALNAEVFALSTQWPGSAPANAYPVCTQASTDNRCPNAAEMQNVLPSPDTASASWTVQVFDNGVNAQGQSSASFYSDSVTGAQPAYDANGDDKVWVRAAATINGKTRTVVGLSQVQLQQENVPHDVLIAGSTHTSNAGNKVLINTQGTAPSPSQVLVRCPSSDSGCISIGKPNQINPSSACYSDQCTVPNPVLSLAAQARMKQVAVASGTYFATCPPTLPSAPVVWIDSGNCSYTGNLSTTDQLLVINNGTIEFAGNTTFYGVVYALNAQNSSDRNSWVVSTHGNGHIYGAVWIDGQGAFEAGSSHENLTFDPSAFSVLQSFGKAMVLQDTFREIPSQPSS